MRTRRACGSRGGAQAAFPYLPSGGSAGDFSTYRSGAGVVPTDLGGNDWKFAATPEPGSTYIGNAKELNGVRGAHVVDSSAAVTTAWKTTTGRPDVTIAVLDSGIKWNDAGAMNDLRFKVRLNRGELPMPQVGGPTRDATAAAPNCPRTPSAGAYDANGDGVFNTRDYACDPRVTVTGGPRVGPAGLLTPQDVIIAFSQGSFHDDATATATSTTSPAGTSSTTTTTPTTTSSTGTAPARREDSSAEANNGGDTGSCPNCMVVPLRVGDSFVADVNRFAQAVIYAVDNNVLVIQEALGTLNNSALARQAVDYAYDHGVAVMASAADEAAQHHNWPSTLPHTIVTNSVDKYDSTFTPTQKSYLEFNGCTNFSSKVTLSIPSSSCSSNAVGLAAGFAGPDLQRGAERAARGRPRPEPRLGLPAAERERVPDHAQRGAPADRVGQGLARQPELGQPARHRGHAGRRRELHLGCAGAVVCGRAEPGLHRPEPLLPARQRPDHRPAGARDHDRLRDPQLPGAQGLRPVLRLRAREHGEGGRGDHRSDDAARGRDHVARSGTSRSTRRARTST